MKIKYILKLIVYCLLMLIAGIIGLYLSKTYITDEIFKEIGKSISISVITATFFTIIINIFQRNYFEEKLSDILENKLPLFNRVMSSGLSGIEKSFPIQLKNYEPSFIDSDEVTLVFNDGKRFYQNNITIFRKRFSQKGKKTKFILMNPNSDDSISVLTRKNDHKGDYYKDKIQLFIEELKKESKNYQGHNIEIYVHDLFTTMSIIATDKYIMLSLYRISPGQAEVPHLVIEKNSSAICEYNNVIQDVSRLIEYAEKLL